MRLRFVLLALAVVATLTRGSLGCSPETAVCECGVAPTGPGYCPNGVTADSCACPLYQLCAGYCEVDGGVTPAPCDVADAGDAGDAGDGD